MVICIFGDSITWGAFLPFRGAWANLLRNYLESLNKMIAVYDLGIDTNTSQDLVKRFNSEASARKPSAIIFAVGTNDSAYRKSRDKPLVPLNQFKENLGLLIKQARKYTAHIFFVGLVKGDDSKTKPIPRSTTGKCYTRENVRIFNDAVKLVCEKKRVSFIEVFDLLKDEDFDDGLHPNLGGHQKIFEAVRRILLNSGVVA